MNTIKQLREIKDNIIKDYLENKMSQRQLAKKYNTYQVSVQKLFKENNVKSRKNTEANRKYKLNYNFFDEINTPNKAYILGFLYADGTNNKKYSTIKLSLQDSDKEILEKIKDNIGSERPLGFYQRNNKNIKHKDVYELIIQSSYMCNILERYGMMPKKSLILQFPKWLKKDLYPHFIRGYFDGDGHLGKLGRGAHCSFVSSIDYCNGLSNFLLKEIPDARQKVVSISTNKLTGRLISSDKKSVKIIMGYIYKDCNKENNILFMERKYKIYLKKFYPEMLNQDEEDS